MKATVDSDKCTGCGLCTDTCPEVFEIDEEEGVARVKVEEVPPEAEDCCRQAEEECPMEAISVEE